MTIRVSHPAGESSLVVSVLGMHRSGTSCLTGSLEEAGLVLGEVNRQAPHNRKGNRENSRIMVLHDDLLRSNGGSWDAPPETVIWSDDHRRRRDEILDDYLAVRTWGFKDPRTLLTLEGWLEALPGLRIVGTFRSPWAVAASLFKRNGESVERWLELWTHYNRLLLGYRERLGFDLISFDASPSGYLTGLGEIVRGLGLAQPAGGFQFFQTDLRTAALEERGRLPRHTADLYDRLKQAAADRASAARGF